MDTGQNKFQRVPSKKKDLRLIQHSLTLSNTDKEEEKSLMIP